MADIPFRMKAGTADNILTEAQYVTYDGTTNVKDKIAAIEKEAGSGCYKRKGSKASFDVIKAEVTSGSVGDVYNAEDTDMNYAIASISSQTAAVFTIADNTVTVGVNETVTLSLIEHDTDGNTVLAKANRACKVALLDIVDTDADEKYSKYCLYFTDTDGVDHIVLSDGTEIKALKDSISMYDSTSLESEGFIDGDYLLSDNITKKNVITWDALGGDTTGKVDKPATTVASGKVLTTTGNGETEWADVQMGMTDDEKADLEKLMLKNFPITASVSISPSVIEKGVSTKVTLTWGSVQVDGAAVSSTATVNGTTSTSPFSESISTSKNYTLVITSGSRTLTTTKSVAAYYPTWYGFANYVGTAITSSNISELMTALSSSKSLKASATFSATATNSTAGNGFCIITPYKLNHVKFMTVDILADEFTMYTVTYNGATYYCYVGKALATGSFSYDIS